MYQKNISVFVSTIVFLIFAVCAKADISDMQTSSQGFIVAEEVDIDNELCPECVSFDLRGVDIRSVLQILAYKSGMNIVASPEVEGLVTLKLDNVPWQEALDVVLNMHGFGYEQKGSVITVTTVERLKILRHNALLLADQEALTTKTLVLDYASAAEVIFSLEKMLTPRGTLTYDQRTNAIIITDTISNVRSVKDVVKRLDETTPQVLIEAMVIQTTLGDDERFGIDWTLQAEATGASRPMYFPFRESISIPFASGTNMNFPSPAQDVEYLIRNQFTFGTLNFSQLRSALEFLKSRAGTETLSNPSIVTLDNEKARIVVGVQYPLPRYRYNEDQARLQVEGWDYKDIGIIFEVVPQINRAGYVTLQVDPKITAIVDTTIVEGTEVPILSTEEASTRVRIKDGQTLVIAGLIKEDLQDSVKKVPLLGNIPILGMAFRKTDQRRRKTELVVFITPRIITDFDADQHDLLQERRDSLKISSK